MVLRSMFVAAAVLFAVLSNGALASPMAPRVSVDTINALTVPERPYDETADADSAVDAALARARQSHKLVLIDLGGNWCADCRILAGIMDLPEMRAFLTAHYEVVSVDVGRFNKNLQIPARYGITSRLVGVPSVLVVTPHGTLVDRGHISALADARSMSPQGIADWLAQWAR
jgi:thiol:disulfide interchange protein